MGHCGYPAAELDSEEEAMRARTAANAAEQAPVRTGFRIVSSVGLSRQPKCTQQEFHGS
jgi:hypothetical protein